RNNRPKLLLLHKTRVIADVGYNRRRKKVSRPIQRVTTGKNPGARLALGIFEKVEHLVVLHLVLQWAHLHFGLEPVSYAITLRHVSQDVTDLIVAMFRNIDPLNGHADLPTIGKRSVEYLGCHGFVIGVIEQNRWIIATQFKRDALQGARRTPHDALSSR